MTDMVVYSSEQRQLIHDTVAKGCSETEFALLMELAKRYELDPFQKQIWAVKYGSREAAIFCGRDGFLAIAHRSGVFDGMESGTRKDEDGEIIGWCRVYRRDMTRPFEVEVYMREYESSNNPLWKSKPRTMLQKVAECFDDQTKVLTKNGFIPFEDVDETTWIAQVDDSLHISFVRPDNIIREEYSGPVYHFTNTKCEMVVTPNHRIITTAGVVIVEDLVDALRERVFPTAIRIAGTAVDEDYPVSDDVIKFMAAYTADGWKHGRSMLAIAVSRDYKIKFLSDLNLHTSKWGVKPDKKLGKTPKTRFMYPVDLKNQMHDFVDCDLDKYIDVDQFLKLSKRQLRLFIDTIVLFDGHAYHKEMMFSTSRDQHLAAIATLAVCAGYSVKEHPDSFPQFANGPVHRLAINSIGEVPLRKKYWKKETYSGKIHCVTVPTGKIVVMRDGYSHISGNSQALRRAFSVSGLYSPEEFDDAPQQVQQQRPMKDVTPPTGVLVCSECGISIKDDDTLATIREHAKRDMCRDCFQVWYQKQQAGEQV